ncbi:hypothetical protein [Stutzerimonas frequens]|uniref:hypothetical protein n=1 Tax=Stutzerimonas frequens TaxID=2968969 RepID=UPI002557611A|nr:hypothetical protein [Stutzerimonas frequens]MDL0438691.1 hypothetical protein [Stutzerimonas frequens]
MDRKQHDSRNMKFQIDKDLLAGDGWGSQCDADAFHEHLHRGETLAQLNNFGLWMLSIQEAAELIACDMWANGEIEVEALEDFDGPLRAPEVKEALAELISVFVKRLINAVEIGRLKAERVARDFDENIIVSESFVAYEPLEQWINERGYSFGDTFKDWLDEEIGIADRLIDELIWLRSVHGKTRKVGLSVGFMGLHGHVDESSQDELFAAYKSAVLENQHLRERLAKAEVSQPITEERPASPKSRNTYLRTIAALGYALIGGSTGQPHVDAAAMLAALARKSVVAPLEPKTLAEYLKKAAAI